MERYGILQMDMTTADMENETISCEVPMEEVELAIWWLNQYFPNRAYFLVLPE